MSKLQQEVLRLYRRILRTGRIWEAKNPSDTDKERKYILDEARYLFRKNKGVQDEEEIKQHIREGAARLEMALHYRNPYPRPVNLPPSAIANPLARKWKRQERLLKQSKPVYIKSIDPQK